MQLIITSSRKLLHVCMRNELLTKTFIIIIIIIIIIIKLYISNLTSPLLRPFAFSRFRSQLIQSIKATPMGAWLYF